MAHKIQMVQNDTAPPIDFYIVKEDSSIYNTTGVTVDFFIKRADTGALTNTGHTACTHVDDTQGHVRYDFLNGDVPVEGSYTCDLQVTDGSGKKQTEVEITQIIARAETG